MSRIHLGTSGFVYRHWKGLLYPEKLPARRWLERYAQVFSTVEMNTTFYRLPTAQAVERWRDETPKGFVFACKGSRFLTHMKRLTDTTVGVKRYFDLVLRLGPKLGPILWQLPPQMTKPDPDRLARFLGAMPRGTRHAFEVRSEGWYTDEICDVLDRFGCAFCEHDLLGRPPPRVTGGFRYVRFHGATGRYDGRYGRDGLERWARDLRSWRRRGREAWVYFNNDLHGHALYDALELSELLGEPLDADLPAHHGL